MAAFDLAEAARQGRGETIPPRWRKFPASRSTLWVNFISYACACLVMLGIAIYLLISGAAQNTAILEFSAFVALGVIFLSISLRLVAPLRNRAGYFSLITTDGFVLVAGHKVVGLPFAEIKAAQREPGLLGTKLVVERRSGKALVLPIGRVYGAGTLREIEEGLTASLASQSQGKPKKARRG